MSITSMWEHPNSANLGLPLEPPEGGGSGVRETPWEDMRIDSSDMSS